MSTRAAVRTARKAVDAAGPRPHGGVGHVWALVGGAVIIALALPAVSTAIGLYDRIEHWGKLVHAVDGFLVTLVVGLLMLGWRDRAQIDLSDQLTVLMSMLIGVTFGMLWEVVEFVIDWVWSTDLQKSNLDTMTDFLWSDIALVIGALLAGRIYCKHLSAAQRDALGGLGVWLTSGPSRLLDRHGLLIALLVSLVMALGVAGVWFAGRPVPGFPIS